MTEQEALIVIQSIPEKIWNQMSEPDNKAIGMAFKALEKQVAKKILDVNVVHPKKLFYYTSEDRWCPTCGGMVFDGRWKRDRALAMHKAEYCIYCGQKLYWNEEEK